MTQGPLRMSNRAQEVLAERVWPGQVWRAPDGREVTIIGDVAPLDLEDEDGEPIEMDGVRVAHPRDGEKGWGGSFIALNALQHYAPLPGTSAAARMLAEFHDHPNALENAGTNTQDLRRILHHEEHKELMHELDEAAEGRPNLWQIARELADVLYVTYGSAWAFGIDLDAALREVHRAAMDKMEAGVRREDGKIMKPPWFRPPDMTLAIRTAFAEPEVRPGHSLHEADCPRSHPGPSAGELACRCARSASSTQGTGCA